VPFEVFAWVLLATLVGVLLGLDLFVFHREHRRIGVREAASWVAVWVTLGLAFAGFVFAWRGGEAGGAYLAGYLIEYSLSMDNVFVFAVLFAYFAVPAEYQHRLLFWGVLGAIVFRLAFILAGTSLLEAFHPLIYLFGAILVATGVRLATTREQAVKPERNPLLRVLRRFIPLTDTYHGPAFTIRREGRLMGTPLLAALIAIESSDLLFAVDSVPAVLAITTDPFIVFSSNAFAILGLRALYFLLADLVHRFVYLKVGLGLLLVLAGAKMLATDLVSLPIWVSLAVIVGVLGAAIAASLWATRGGAREA